MFSIFLFILSLHRQTLFNIVRFSLKPAVTTNSNVVMDLASNRASDAIVVMTAVMDLTSENVQLHAALVTSNVELASASVRAESAIVMLIAAMEATKMIVVS